jgi:hypothetical protein
MGTHYRDIVNHTINRVAMIFSRGNRLDEHSLISANALLA